NRNVVSDQVVSPFGHVVSHSGSLSDPFALAGQRLEGGVYPMGARYMDPELALFTSPDPTDDDANRYAYAHNDPNLFTDPTGYTAEQGSSTMVTIPAEACAGGPGGYCDGHSIMDDVNRNSGGVADAYLILGTWMNSLVPRGVEWATGGRVSAR